MNTIFFHDSFNTFKLLDYYMNLSTLKFSFLLKKDHSYYAYKTPSFSAKNTAIQTQYIEELENSLRNFLNIYVQPVSLWRLIAATRQTNESILTH